MSKFRPLFFLSFSKANTKNSPPLPAIKGG
uniref:Uncharacterized protein n=1 Tax=Anguilla anguilla TaxID=7936 RepID=A0A0E9SCD6_ANGAN